MKLRIKLNNGIEEMFDLGERTHIPMDIIQDFIPIEDDIESWYLEKIT